MELFHDNNLTLCKSMTTYDLLSQFWQIISSLIYVKRRLSKNKNKNRNKISQHPQSKYSLGLHSREGWMLEIQR